MENFDIRHILVDGGSSVDIMYTHLFTTLQLDESNMSPYLGSDLQGFNGRTTRSWRYVELKVTLREKETAREVNVRFLVIEFPSLYNCILGRKTMAELTAVPSTVHLKMKYYTRRGAVVTLNSDIEVAQRCFKAALKGLSTIAPANKKSSRAPPK